MFIEPWNFLKYEAICDILNDLYYNIFDKLLQLSQGDFLFFIGMSLHMSNDLLNLMLHYMAKLVLLKEIESSAISGKILYIGIIY